MHRPSEITVGSAKGLARSLTFADFIDEAAPLTQYQDGQRVGPYAWSQVAPSGDFVGGGRDYVVRAQKALNQNLPVWMAWWADDEVIAADGTYRVRPGLPVGPSAYLHASLIVDYQVDAPGFGLLLSPITSIRYRVTSPSDHEGPQISTTRSATIMGSAEPADAA